VQKKPITDPWKNSKAGRLKLIKDYTGFKTVGLDEPGEDLLRVVYENGRVATDNLDNIRRRANEV
jgi:nicotinamide phosphoribosyltransferase